MHCRNLAHEMLQALSNGTEMIPAGDWPEFDDNSNSHILGRETVCNMLNLAYNEDVRAPSMQVARAILCECIARADSQASITLDNMRQSSRLINIPQVAQMQVQLNGLSERMGRLDQRIDGLDQRMDQRFNELMQAIQELKSDINKPATANR